MQETVNDQSEPYQSAWLVPPKIAKLSRSACSLLPRNTSTKIGGRGIGRAFVPSQCPTNAKFLMLHVFDKLLYEWLMDRACARGVTRFGKSRYAAPLLSMSQ